MHDSLTGYLASVHTDIEATGFEGLQSSIPNAPEQLEHSLYLVLFELEEVRDMPEGNDQRMSRAHGESILPGVAELVAQLDV